MVSSSDFMSGQKTGTPEKLKQKNVNLHLQLCQDNNQDDERGEANHDDGLCKSSCEDVNVECLFEETNHNEKMISWKLFNIIESRKSALGTCQSGSYCDKWNKDGSADCKRHCPPVSLSQRSSSSSKSSLPVPIFVIIISSICSSSFSITLPRFLAKPSSLWVVKTAHILNIIAILVVAFSNYAHREW